MSRRVHDALPAASDRTGLPIRGPRERCSRPIRALTEELTNVAAELHPSKPRCGSVANRHRRGPPRSHGSARSERMAPSRTRIALVIDVRRVGRLRCVGWRLIDGFEKGVAQRVLGACASRASPRYLTRETFGARSACVEERALSGGTDASALRTISCDRCLDLGPSPGQGRRGRHGVWLLSTSGLPARRSCWGSGRSFVMSRWPTSDRAWAQNASSQAADTARSAGRGPDSVLLAVRRGFSSMRYGGCRRTPHRTRCLPSPQRHLPDTPELRGAGRAHACYWRVLAALRRAVG
jgi:hypothetical protein